MTTTNRIADNKAFVDFVCPPELLNLDEYSTSLNNIVDNMEAFMDLQEKTEKETKWVEVMKNNFRPNQEYLLAFISPKDHLPMMRVGKINKNNDLLIMTGPGGMLDFINLGDYTKLGKIWFKKLPNFPKGLLEKFNWN